MPPKPIYLRTTIIALPVGNAASPADVSGSATITGEMREGQTISFAWPTVSTGVPPASAVVEYTVLATTNAGASYSIHSQGSTPPASASLLAADIGKQFYLRARVHNAATFVDAVPQITSDLSSAVTAIPLIAPTFASGPTISGTPANGQIMTVAFTTAGSPTITPSIRWLINTGIVVGQTGTTWTGLGLSGGDLVKAQVQLTGPGGTTAWVDSNSLLVATGTISQAASFGSMNFPSEGGWRPQLADGRVENIASYVGLTSGSLGVYTPTIVSPGKLAFTGANGAPNGAVLRIAGVSGRLYDVTVSQELNRRDLSDDIDVSRNRSASYHVGKRVVVRQNAKLSKLTRLVAAQSFMNCANSTATTSGLNAPTAFEGEGPNTFDEEYHLHSYRVTPLSELTIKNMRFADQKTDSSIILEASASIRPYNITISGNRGYIDYDVDGSGADWSMGFPSTGYAQHRHLYVTGGGYISNIEVLDNEWRGGYIQVEIIASGYNDVSGNRLLDTYGDFRKHNTNRLHGTDSVSFTGGNYVSLNKTFSVNEIPATVPHPDGFQVTSGGPGTLVTHSEYNVVYHATNLPLQPLFHADRRTTQTGGHNWIMHGDFQITRTTHAATNDWPESIDLNRFMIVPSNTAPLPQPNTTNLFKLGSAKVGDGNAAGSNVIANSTSNGYSIHPNIAATVNLTTPGYVDTGNWTSTDFGNNLLRWNDWPTMPAETTHADAMSFSEAVPSSPFESVTPFGQFTPGAILQSEYTIPGTSVFANNPAMLGLTVTDNTNGAFTVDPNLNYTSTVFWNITASAVNNARDIQRGVVGKTGVFAWGIKNRVGATGLLVCQGAPTYLAAGNYVLNVARFDGRKKTMVANVAFTAP